MIVTFLLLHLGEIQGLGINTGRRTGLEPPQRQTFFLKRFRQTAAGALHAVRTGMRLEIPMETDGIQIGAGADDRCFAWMIGTGSGDHPLDLAILYIDIDDFALADLETFLFLQCVLHRLLVSELVRLRTQRVDRRSLARVQHAGLDIGLIDILAHLPAQGIDLTDQMAFRRAADAGVAGHHCDTVQIDSKHDAGQAHARDSKSCLTSRMAASDDCNIHSLFQIHLYFS